MNAVLLHLGVGGPRWLDWSLHLDTIALVIVLAEAYRYAVVTLRPRVSDAGRVKRSQVLLFAGGLLALLAAGGSPLHDLGENYWLSAHMFQHLLFTLVAAPLLVAGVPAWLWQYLLCGERVLPIMRILTRPLVAFGIFNGLLLITHLSPPVDLALRVGAFHFAVHAALVLAAMLMWWPVLSPLEELPPLSAPMKMAYLFLQSLLPSVMASFITFADRPVYPFYREAPRLLEMSAITDQQVAGGLMKVLGSLILWSFITAVFFRWYSQEEAESQGPRWDEVQAELEEMGIRQ
jgi:putative membrane protein